MYIKITRKGNKESMVKILEARLSARVLHYKDLVKELPCKDHKGLPTFSIEGNKVTFSTCCDSYQKLISDFLSSQSQPQKQQE